MPTSLPVPTVSVGQTFTDTLFNSYLRDNINKLLNQAHRVLTVAQFAALTGLEGTKGTVAPDEVYLEVDSANGIQWHLAYESGEPTYKWRFIGGPPMRATVATSEATSSTTYVDLTTVGPSIIAPRAGEYDISHGHEQGSSAITSYSSPKLGAAATSDNDRAALCPGAGTGTTQRVVYQKALALSDTVKLQYKVGTSSVSIQSRALSICPVRIS
jgi:hypothetical protein